MNQKTNKQISIPLFIPVVIIIVSILLVTNIYNPKVIATQNEKIEENTTQNNLQIQQMTDSNKEDNQKDNEVKEEVEKNNQNESAESSTKTTTYTASNGEQYTVIAGLNIPSLGIEYPILSATSDELLKLGLNKYWGANPNEVGNMVIVGHNYNDNKYFSKLPKIKKGAIVKITDLTGKTLDYEVYHTEVIDPYDNSCTSQLTDGHTEITLITCYNYGRTRFVAKARAY